ncbi:unnamed protein product, partial [Lymnaea stagnalis]
IQWRVNDGQCGLCGDSWSGSRDYERPNGSMVQHGIIPKTYSRGDVITVTLEITANLLGWNEFRICDIATTGGIEATQDCLDQNLLADEKGRTRFHLSPKAYGRIEYELVLPSELACRHCLIQWKWKAGNNWGCNETGCGLGYGDYQEQYRGCSDVAIMPNSYNSDVRDNAFTTEDEDNKVTTEDNDNEFTTEDRDNTFTTEDRDNNFTTEDSDNKFTTEDSDNKVTTEDRDNILTTEDYDNKFNNEDRGNKLTTEDNDNNFTTEDNDNKFTTEDNDNNFTTEDSDNKFTKE